MNRSLPIAVDLDGTLIRTDLLHEAVLRLLKRNFLYLFLLPLWLLGGRAQLKARIAECVDIDAASLPYNEVLVEYLREQRSRGRQLLLATATQAKFADAVAAHLGLFDSVLATSATNMKGANKAQALVELLGDKAFAYAGNESADLDVWRHAGASIVVSSDPGLAARADALAANEWVQPMPRAGLLTYVRACRLHQWVKNLLIFVPLLTAQKFLDAILVSQSLAAFVAFGLCASSVYLLNDLLDLEADREHRSKCLRPFACGALPIAHGIVLIPVLLGFAILIASLLPPQFAFVLAIYYLATSAYSFVLKRKIVVDVLLLAGLYTCRIVAGGAATGVPISEWLLAFSLFIFLSLAILKRYTELVDLRERGIDTVASGRAYSVNDIDLLASLGSASGYISVLVFALYLNSEAVRSMYGNALLLWGVCPLLLYWISRAWLLAHRGQMDEDPILFAIKDRTSRCVGLLVVLMFLLATL